MMMVCSASLLVTDGVVGGGCGGTWSPARLDGCGGVDACW